MTVAQRLAEHVVATRYEQIPASAITAAKTFLLDTLAVGVAGSSMPGADAVRAAAARSGRTPEAAILGTALRLPAQAAAFVNGHHIHCQEFDCVHEPAVVHAMSVLTPAALAFAERAGGVNGRDLLTALVLGVDVAVTVGLNPKGDWRFFRPATAGAFGAVAALGKLAGLDRAQLVDAFGLVLGQVSGTMQPHGEGKPLLPLQIGFSARNAIAAIDLALAGFGGTRETFEGEQGYFALFEGSWDASAALAELGVVWRVSELSHKPYPAGRATHGLIDGLLRLRAEHDFSTDEVEQIILLGSPLIVQLVGRPPLADMSASHARLCARYVGAVALLRGTVGLDDFTPERLRDPASHALATRITVEVDAQTSGNVLLPQALTVRLRDGSTLRLAVSEVLGSPARPLSRDQRLAKLRACWARSAVSLPTASADRLATTIDRLETIPNANALMALAARPSPL